VLVLPMDVDAPEWIGHTIKFGEASSAASSRRRPGSTSASDVWAKNHMEKQGTWKVQAQIGAGECSFSLTPGAPHRLHNALAALAAIHAAGLDVQALAKKFNKVGIMTGRGVEQTAGGITVIDDSFNGNPASVRAAIESLKARPLKNGRRIAILGDMLELGDEAPKYHEGLNEFLIGIDGIYCVGHLMRHLYDLLPVDKGLGWHDDPATIDVQKIAHLLRPGDVVVVKGSKKMFWVNKFVPRLLAALQSKA
jgi:UDP-N-acetylmuramoyl-tripeptide--D-alanyl-D-alanine ligase